MERKSGWKKKTAIDIKDIFSFCEGYKKFLDEAKTEREAVVWIEQALRANGFASAPTGPRFFRAYKGKAIIAFRNGTADIREGLRIVTAHIDSPRLDLKQDPLYEDVDLALLRTHYYGGIKKYQWVAMPLAIHGVVVKKDGRVIPFAVGEADHDPVFAIDDLLPHLSRRTQDKKEAGDAIDGEKLTILFGSIPLVGEEKEAVKKSVVKLLLERYDIQEEDLLSAELQVVPAFKARDVGIDLSMIGAYGQDDRASAYPLLRAMIEMDDPVHPSLAIFVDKEEIGSEGNTSAKSQFLRLFLYDVLESLNIPVADHVANRVLFSSKAISADVNGPVNPNWQEVHEKQNACYLGHGVCITKFTGSGGKVGANDAHAEYMAEIRRLLDGEGVIWQTGEMGKVDEGGGGTVAKYLAEYGMDILDAGAPILAMHSPFELSSKLDIFETYKALKAFLAAQ
ncbi:MAG TPA: aminopeptidase [Deltaproteobacteria bacterium]|nr:aminopeptidase [Deltaproteobacteria bacterium]